MKLPRFAVFQVANSGMYLQYCKEEKEVLGFIRLSEGGEGVMSPYAKHQVEMEKSGKGRVHIRCCFNNKYWRLASEGSWWIAAVANEPEEDESKWSCTLIDPQIVLGKSYNFYHVATNRILAGRRYSHARSDEYLQATTGDSNQLTVIDWESLVKLPQQVAFKGDNHKYLSARPYKTDDYVEFESDDIGDPTVGNEVFTNPDGSIRIKSNYTGKFWRRIPGDWIRPDAEENEYNSETLFSPVKINNNVIALRNMSNGAFCKRVISEDKNYLQAGISTITKEALIEVEELVLARNIYAVDYDLANAKIYNENAIVAAEGYAVNNTDRDNTVDVKLSYKDIRSKKWSSHSSLKIGLKAHLDAKIPFVGDLKVDFSADYSDEYEWGETLETTDTVDTNYTVDVPAKTTMKVVVKATKGHCDIPFTYYQRDVLTNGENVVSRKEDGIYSGISCFNFQYESEPVKPPTKPTIQV